MIVRPPEKNPISKQKTFSPFFSKVANDNQPPQKIVFGWFLFMLGLLLIVDAFFWV